MELRIDRGAPRPIYQQISQFYRTRILQGALPPGFLLPPERTLARSLGVNRTTVMNAYAELKADRLVRGRVGHGTRVLPTSRDLPPRPREIAPLRWSDLARPSDAARDQELHDLLALSESRDTILLSLGFPAPELIPRQLLDDAVATVLRDRGPGAYFYGPAEGVTSFREALGDLMSARGVVCGADEILVTSGSQQALDLLARALIEPGDTVVVEEPTYLGALHVFRTARARLVTVPVDADGLSVDHLEHVLTRCQPKFVYTLPTYQNPSGALMSPRRRAQLLALAYRFGIPIVEDDIYGDLWYDQAPPPSLRALDRHGYVIYTSSFSKILAPGLRVGWISGPRAIVRRLVQVKQAADLQASTLSQMIVEQLLRSGGYARHAAAVRSRYAARRDAMESALRKRARGWAEWNRPGGGFYFWCRVTAPVPIGVLTAAAAQRDVSILPGAACLAEESADAHIRLSFSFAGVEEIAEGIAHLTAAVRHASGRVRPSERQPVATRPLI
jgi:DNA-binding transcriptional MocR family regulator